MVFFRIYLVTTALSYLETPLNYIVAKKTPEVIRSKKVQNRIMTYILNSISKESRGFKFLKKLFQFQKWIFEKKLPFFQINKRCYFSKFENGLFKLFLKFSGHMFFSGNIFRKQAWFSKKTTFSNFWKKLSIFQIWKCVILKLKMVSLFKNSKRCHFELFSKNRDSILNLLNFW